MPSLTTVADDKSPSGRPSDGPASIGRRSSSGSLAAIACAFARGGRAQREHRADGVLPGAVAGRHGGAVLPGRGRFCRRDAAVDLCRRHACAVDLRRDAHVAGSIRLDEDRAARKCRLRCWSVRCLFAVLVWAAFSVPAWRGLDRAAAEALPLEPTAAPIGMGLLGARVDAPDRSGYLLVFEIISVHLLVVLIGAAYLARAETETELGDRMNLLMLADLFDQFDLTRARGRVALSARRRGAVCVRRALHGHEAKRAGRVDGHRAGAQRGEFEFHRVRQPLSCEATPTRSVSTAN